jgi:hypothetical protein
MKPIVAFALVASVLASGARAGAASPLSYTQIKAAVAAVRAQASATSPDVTSGGLHGGQYDVMDCGESDYTGDMKSRASAYAFIADKVLIWERDLPRLGYPRRIWSGPVARFESSAIYVANSVKPDDFYEAYDNLDVRRRGLQNALLAYRKTHPRAVDIANGLGCGGGELPVKLVTQPAAVQVSIIPAFFFELCRVQKIDPNDTSRCAHWHEVTGPIVEVSGNYRYVARWHDGTVKRGILDVESAADAGTITLRKP